MPESTKLFFTGKAQTLINAAVTSNSTATNNWIKYNGFFHRASFHLETKRWATANNCHFQCRPGQAGASRFHFIQHAAYWPAKDHRLHQKPGIHKKRWPIFKKIPSPRNLTGWPNCTAIQATCVLPAMNWWAFGIHSTFRSLNQALTHSSSSRPCSG